MSLESDLLHTVLIAVPLSLRGQAMSAMEFMEPAPVGVGLFQYDAGGERWEVGGCFDRDPRGHTLSMILSAFGTDNVAVGRMTRADWSLRLQRQMKPVRTGRFTVHGPLDSGDAPLSSIRIRMEAMLAFGVGHHPSTRGVLLALSTLARRGVSARRVLDLGVGTGALSIAAARLWKARCVATDIDPSAVSAVRVNARASGAGIGIRALRTDRATHPAVAGGAPYDLILANIRPAPLRWLAPQIARLSQPGGRIVISGLREAERLSVERVFAGWGMTVRERLKIREWRTLLFERVTKFPRGGMA